MLNVTINVRTGVTLREAKVAFSIEIRKEMGNCVWQNVEIRLPAVC